MITRGSLGPTRTVKLRKKNILVVIIVYISSLAEEIGYEIKMPIIEKTQIHMIINLQRLLNRFTCIVSVMSLSIN